MSGIKRKGPDRPPEETTPVSTESAPLYQRSGLSLEGKYPKIVMIVLCIILALMFILAFSFCVAGGVQYQQPRYFLLIINIILSTFVTGLLIFWFYRGSLSSTMLWYVFVQCVFLLFQFITTDIFAWYEASTAPTPPPTEAPSWAPIANCSAKPLPPECGNGSNGSNGTFFGPAFEEKYLQF